MPSTTPVRRAAILLLTGSTVAFAQSTLPAIAPTSAPVAAPNPISSSTVPPQPAHRAAILYVRGQLTVLADNSSLNQILSDVAHQTGMTITGGVADQRVYGTIGPASPAEVLTNLLDGAGADMLLRESASQVPAELILIPRQTGPSSSIPAARASSPAFAASYPINSATPGTDFAAQRMQRGNAQETPNLDANSASGPPGTRLGNMGAGAASPDGPESPQQVYERLLQLQRTQAQQPANPQQLAPINSTATQ